MDSPTVIESLLYRCEGRGETYGEFVQEYCSREELVAATQSPGDEGKVATALLALHDAMQAFQNVWLPIANERLSHPQ